MSINNQTAKTVSNNEAQVREHIANLLVSAFEGGSNYWYMIEDHNKKEIPECEFLSELLSYEGGKILISDGEGQLDEPKWIHHVDTSKAWYTFTHDQKYARHYANLLSENDDAETGDVFLQLCVFGEVIYG